MLSCLNSRGGSILLIDFQPESCRLRRLSLNSDSWDITRPPRRTSAAGTPRQSYAPSRSHYAGIAAAFCLCWPIVDDVSQLLKAVEQGDAGAARQLLPLVYDELRRLAAQRLAEEKPGQ